MDVCIWLSTNTGREVDTAHLSIELIIMDVIDLTDSLLQVKWKLFGV